MAFPQFFTISNINVFGICTLNITLLQICNVLLLYELVLYACCGKAETVKLVSGIIARLRISIGVSCEIFVGFLHSCFLLVTDSMISTRYEQKTENRRLSKRLDSSPAFMGASVVLGG